MNLFINTYADKNPERDKELQECLRLNKLNPILNVYELQGRPTFRDIFNVVNSVTNFNDYNIISNSDIYFDADINCVVNVLQPDQCFALSRWDIQPDGSAVHYNNPGSQDTWIFRGAIRMVEGANFTQGIPGCENKLAYLLTQAGYKVTNPSLTLKTYHLHLSGIRYYDKDRKGRQLPKNRVYRLPLPRMSVSITALP